jgi:hypothetical protein
VNIFYLSFLRSARRLRLTDSKSLKSAILSSSEGRFCHAFERTFSGGIHSRTQAPHRTLPSYSYSYTGGHRAPHPARIPQHGATGGGAFCSICTYKERFQKFKTFYFSVQNFLSYIQIVLTGSGINRTTTTERKGSVPSSPNTLHTTKLWLTGWRMM